MTEAIPKIVEAMSDPLYGGVLSDDDWENDKVKYTIVKHFNTVTKSMAKYQVTLLAFRTSIQRDMFMEKNMDIIREYLMIN